MYGDFFQVHISWKNMNLYKKMTWQFLFKNTTASRRNFITQINTMKKIINLNNFCHSRNFTSILRMIFEKILSITIVWIEWIDFYCCLTQLKIYSWECHSIFVNRLMVRIHRCIIFDIIYLIFFHEIIGQVYTPLKLVDDL